MSYISVGQSAHPEAYLAGCEAVQQALANCGTPNHFKRRGVILAILFASPNYPQIPLVLGVSRSLGAATLLVGCTCRMQITNSGISTNSATVMLLWASSRTSAVPLLVKDTQRPVAEISRQVSQDVSQVISGIEHDLVRVVRAHQQVIPVRPYTLFLFGAGLDGELLHLVDDIGRKLGPTFQVIGSMAEGEGEGVTCYQYLNGDLYQNAVVGFVLINRAPTAIAVNDGWSPYGPNMVVTRANGMVLHELDGKPAREVLDGLLGSQGRATNNLARNGKKQHAREDDFFHAQEIREQHQPMSQLSNLPTQARDVGGVIRLLEKENNRLICQFDRSHDNGALILHESILEGSSVQWMAYDPFDRVGSARSSAQQAVDRLGRARPMAAMLFMPSQKFRGQDSNSFSLTHELHAVRQVIGYSVPLVGFSTASEAVASHPVTTALNSQMSVICLIGG